MTRQVKICGFIASVVACVLILAAGCTDLAEETAKTKIEPEKTIETKVEPEEQKPTIKLALKFTPQDSTTYRVIMEAQKSGEWAGSLPSKPSAFKGGHTGNRVEMTFTQHIQSTDDEGNAVAKITIKALKYLATVRDNPILDFDSSREEDRDSPLGKLIGQSYTIEITASGQVSKVIDTSGAQAAVGDGSSAGNTATMLLSANAIKERHTIPALPAADKSQLRTGDNWSSIETFSFDMMGSKSYEKIYTLKEIKDTDGRRVAIAEMNAVPSSEMAEQLHKEEATSFFAKMFDNTETYTGQLKLDLAAGKVEKCVEELKSEWLAVDPSASQGKEKPDALRLTAIRLYSIERID
jgi:hypothetical protein